MGRRYLTLIRTGRCVERCRPGLAALFEVAQARCPDGFPAEETRELDLLREHLSLAFVGELRSEVSAQAGIPIEWLSLDRFTIHGCGPISLHDDRHNYPDLHFVIVVAHSGRLGIVDGRARATRHGCGEILLLDPHKKHALVPEGVTARQHAYERTHSPVRRGDDMFLFLGFDVPRRRLRDRFRAVEGEHGDRMNSWSSSFSPTSVPTTCTSDK
jgi:hypothetical protein